MEILLSFIIPVFNVEEYLEECVCSIIKQAESGFEVILVDDGSTDNSGELCDILAEKYSNIVVLHRENEGPSAARNAGLEIARGLYIGFIDSDDRITEKSIYRILNWICDESADICFMNAIKFYPDGTQEPLGDGIDRKHVHNVDRLQTMRYLASRPRFPGSACTKIFRRGFLECNKIRFLKDRRMHEDLYFVIQCISNAQTFDSLENPYYEYRQGRSESRSQNSIDRSLQDLRLFVEEETECYTNNHTPINCEAECIMSFVAYEYSLILLKYCQLFGEVREIIKEFLKEYKWILRFGKNRRITIIEITLRFLGFGLTSNLLNYYMKRKNVKHEVSSYNSTSSI